MILFNTIKDFADRNKSKKIAMFVDIDGTIASFEFDINKDIVKNNKNVFLNKRPLTSVIKMLEEVSKIQNIDLYILSACVYETQAIEKSMWLEKHAPFFKKENQIFVVKELLNYNKDTKSDVKTKFIVDTLTKRNYDLAIYLEDEFMMLREAHKKLKDRILCVHISNFIE